MFRTKWLAGQVVAVSLLFGADAAWAIPVISVDVDTTTAGIQTTRVVTPGENFSVDIVLTGDGATLFDTLTFDVLFNNAGAVLGLDGGTGNPTWGSLAGAGLPFDIFAVASTSPGTAAATSLPPTPGSPGALGGVGLTDPLSFSGPIANGVMIDILRVDFTALAGGTSTLMVGPLFGSLMSGFSAEIPVDLNTASVTTIPAPAGVILAGLGMASLGGYRRWRRRAA